MPRKSTKAPLQRTSYNGPAIREPNKKSVARRTKQPKRSSAASRKQLAAKICGQVDPFCPQACCQMLGKSSQPSLTFAVKGQMDLTTDASGNGAVYLSPGINLIRNSSNTITSGVVTWNSGGGVPYATEIQSSFGSYRVVCAGIHIFSSCNADESKGVVQVCHLPSNGTPTGFNVGQFSHPDLHRSRLYEYDQYFRFRRNGDEADDYSLTSEDLGHPGWGTFVVSLTGGTASTTVLSVEYIYNLELVTKLGDFTGRMSIPAAPHVPQAEAIVANADTKLPIKADTSTGFSEMFTTFAESALGALAEDAVISMISALV